MLESINMPAKPVIAVHFGAARLHAKLEVNQPLMIPRATTSLIEVVVFHQLASQLIPDEGRPEVSCSIPVRRPDGTDGAQARLRIIRKVSSETASKPAEDCLEKTRAYLQHHQLQEQIQNLIQDVLRGQPGDPFRYMANCLKETKAKRTSDKFSQGAKLEDMVATAAGETSEQLIEVLNPRPPELPKTSGSRPTPAGGRKFKVTNVADSSDSRLELSRSVVRMVLCMPKCQLVAEQSLRQATLKDAACGLASRALEQAMERCMSEFAKTSTERSRS